MTAALTLYSRTEVADGRRVEYRWGLLDTRPDRTDVGWLVGPYEGTGPTDDSDMAAVACGWCGAWGMVLRTMGGRLGRERWEENQR